MLEQSDLATDLKDQASLMGTAKELEEFKKTIEAMTSERDELRRA